MIYQRARIVALADRWSKRKVPGLQLENIQRTDVEFIIECAQGWATALRMRMEDDVFLASAGKHREGLKHAATRFASIFARCPFQAGDLWVWTLDQAETRRRHDVQNARVALQFFDALKRAFTDGYPETKDRRFPWLKANYQDKDIRAYLEHHYGREKSGWKHPLEEAKRERRKAKNSGKKQRKNPGKDVSHGG